MDVVLQPADMPLLDRKEHPPGAKVPPKLSVNDEVFVVRCTGEVVRSYEEYNFKRNLYAQHQWQDKYYGRTGLTYEEALRFEEQAENQIKEQVHVGDGLRLHRSSMQSARQQRDHLVALCRSSPTIWRRALSGRFTTVQ